MMVFKWTGIGTSLIRMGVNYNLSIFKSMTMRIEKAIEGMNTHDYNQRNCD